jgi:hypothetical protein
MAWRHHSTANAAQLELFSFDELARCAPSFFSPYAWSALSGPAVHSIDAHLSVYGAGAHCSAQQGTCTCDREGGAQ